ncbi:MAG: DUF4258 domain-containing protein [Blastocatellia bacterium]
MEMRERVRAGQIAMTIHAIEEMHADGLIMEDLIQAILTGMIVARQYDKEFDEYKYIIEGMTLAPGEMIQVVAKPGRKNTVVITMYRI